MAARWARASGLCCENVEQGFGFAEIGLDEGEVSLREEVAEVAVFVDAVVVRVEVVEADDGVAASEEGGGETGADEAGGAGDEDAHGGASLR